MRAKPPHRRVFMQQRLVGGGEVEAHHPEQRVQEPFGLA